jgi:hypothetical protein
MPPASRPESAVSPSVQEAPGRNLDSGSELFQRRDLRVTYSALDPADLPLFNTAALGDLYLREVEFLTGRPQVLAEVAHAPDRPS